MAIVQPKTIVYGSFWEMTKKPFETLKQLRRQTPKTDKLLRKIKETLDSEARKPSETAKQEYLQEHLLSHLIKLDPPILYNLWYNCDKYFLDSREHCPRLRNIFEVTLQAHFGTELEKYMNKHKVPKLLCRSGQHNNFQKMIGCYLYTLYQKYEGIALKDHMQAQLLLTEAVKFGILEPGLTVSTVVEPSSQSCQIL